MYNYTQYDEIDRSTPNAFEQLDTYYKTEIDSLSFILDQATELIESESERDDSNVGIALYMLDAIAKRMHGMISNPS